MEIVKDEAAVKDANCGFEYYKVFVFMSYYLFAVILLEPKLVLI